MFADIEGTKSFKNVIQEIAENEIRKAQFPTYKAAIVQKINEDGTIDVYLPAYDKNLVTHLLNKTGELLNVGDSVEIATKNGSLTNCWIALKHGTNVQGFAEEIESLNQEVVLKILNGRIVTTTLNRDPALGNSFTVIADDINLDGMNIVLNGSRGITIQSPYFNVTNTGSITATDGTIGGWHLGATKLYSGTGTNYVALDSGTSGTDYAIWAGGENASSAPFRVNRNGAITASSGSIAGNIIASGINASNITTGSIDCRTIDVHHIDADNITTGSIDCRTIEVHHIDADNITTGEMSANRISGGTIDANDVTIKNLNADNITAGTLTVDRIPTLSANKISGGTLDIATRGGGYLRAGTSTTNPEVSGLNVGSAGIKASSGIVATHFGITDSDAGKSASFQVPRQGGGYYYITFTGGILTAFERND